MQQRATKKKTAGWIWVVTFILTIIGTFIVIRRVLLIVGVISGVGERGPNFDSGFHVPHVLTLIHVLPGLLFMTLGPLQFMKKIRFKLLHFHRYSGWVFIVASYIVGLTALFMPLISMPLGGISEAAGSIFFAAFFLFAVTKALRCILRKQIAEHREWMLRTFVIGLAISTVRPLMALAFVILGLTPKEFLGTAFWIGFTAHMIAAEIWINYTRNHEKYKTKYG